LREDKKPPAPHADVSGATLGVELERPEYDSGLYYRDDGSATRLSRAFTPLIHFLDALRVRTVVRGSGVERGRVLDVGAGDGRFLLAMKRAGFEVLGTTASAISAAAAARRGITLRETLDLPSAESDGPYDLITYWHVFEHLEHPETHVPRWFELLSPGGCLMLEIPNLDSLGARICYQAWLGSDPEYHVNKVRETALVEALEQLGLEVIRREWFRGSLRLRHYSGGAPAATTGACPSADPDTQHPGEHPVSGAGVGGTRRDWRCAGAGRGGAPLRA